MATKKKEKQTVTKNSTKSSKSSGTKDYPNLKSFRERRDEDPEAFRKLQSELGRRGQEALKKRRAMRQTMNQILSLVPTEEDKLYREAKKSGIPLDDIDNQMIMLLALYKKAKTGDTFAIKEIRNIIGDDTNQVEQKPVEVKLVLASETLEDE